MNSLQYVTLYVSLFHEGPCILEEIHVMVARSVFETCEKVNKCQQCEMQLAVFMDLCYVDPFFLFVFLSVFPVWLVIEK